jgi:PAS domain S-box-containing protein
VKCLVLLALARPPVVHGGAVAGNDASATKPISASEAEVPLGDASFLRAVLEAIPPFVVRLDPEQRITYINHLRAGLTLHEVVGRPSREFIAPADLEQYERAVESALRSGETCSYVVKGSRAVNPGGAAYYQGHAVPIDHGDGRQGVCIIATDVSEHVARAEALRQSEEKLRIAVEASGIGLWTWNIANDQIEYDSRMIEMMGCKPDSPRDYIARLVHPEDRVRISNGMFNVSAGHPNFFDHRIIRPDGEVRWLLPCGQVTRDENGGGVRVTGGMLDVTAQHKTEEHLRSAQKLDAIGSLTAGVAHNFNNMLAVIVPALQLALRDPGREGGGQVLEDAMHAAHRAAELVAQLMTFAGQRGARSVEPHDLAPMLERAVSMCRRTFQRQVQFETSIDPGCPEVTCDPAAIEQVVVNLLINARDAVIEVARGEPRISVELAGVEAVRPGMPDRDSERFVCIRVRDNGMGMSDAVKQRLFEPFFSTKGPGKGTGLGLATSYGIVRDHGGFILLESEQGAGTSAAVFLPLATKPVIRARQDSPRTIAARRGAVLLVDDEPAVARVVDLLLREWGHDVRVASDGGSAIAVLDEGFLPDLILLDRSMPGWTVQHTLDEIRKRAASVPIVFLTGQHVTNDERAQVQDVLHKPLSTEDLKHSVDFWLRADRSLPEAGSRSAT